MATQPGVIFGLDAATGGCDKRAAAPEGPVPREGTTSRQSGMANHNGGYSRARGIGSASCRRFRDHGFGPPIRPASLHKHPSPWCVDTSGSAAVNACCTRQDHSSRAGIIEVVSKSGSRASVRRPAAATGGATPVASRAPPAITRMVRFSSCIKGRSTPGRLPGTTARCISPRSEASRPSPLHGQPHGAAGLEDRVERGGEGGRVSGEPPDIRS